MKEKLWNGIKPKDVEIISIPNTRIKNLTGKHFGKLTVIGYVGKQKDGHAAWKCLCECGNYTIVAGNDLQKTINPTTSCGCVRKNHMLKLAENNTIDMSGQKFGLLTVLHKSSEQKGHGTWWDCIDEQNHIYSIRGDALRSGHNSGLLNKSKGEFIIANYLKDNNIVYTEQYRFLDCKDKYPLPFDFAVWKDNDLILIEYDGIQHFEFSGKDWNTEEHFIYIKKHDELKNNYCREHNIKLFRINYKDDIVKELKKILGE